MCGAIRGIVSRRNGWLNALDCSHLSCTLPVLPFPTLLLDSSQRMNYDGLFLNSFLLFLSVFLFKQLRVLCHIWTTLNHIKKEELGWVLCSIALKKIFHLAFPIKRVNEQRACLRLLLLKTSVDAVGSHHL